MSMKVFYRISENHNSFKRKLPNATKQHCLENFLEQFPHEEVEIYTDGISGEMQVWLETVGCKLHPVGINGNSGSFLYVLSIVSTLDDNELVYFVEDDYLHLPKARQVLLEGLRVADYVTLYDHPDKYMDPANGGNPFIENGGEITRVVLTHSTHWKLTNSTTMTFAAKASTIKEDMELWKACCASNIPADFRTFTELRNKGRALISPIPGYSTHCEIPWLAPLHNWYVI